MKSGMCPRSAKAPPGKLKSKKGLHREYYGVISLYIGMNNHVTIYFWRSPPTPLKIIEKQFFEEG